jgi:bifunctional N-acetylglucosamine-1-phosphate-uridyltransferase/glucosamine-1-phosphate-acetyltransferase GlmU-like protein
MFAYYGQKRIGISALKSSEKAEFYINKYSLYFIPAGEEKLSPVERVRFYTETAKDKSLNTNIILYTTRFEHKIYGSKAELFDEKKREMYNDISFFLSDADQSEFDKTYTFTEKSAVYGYILALFSMLFVILGPKKSMAPLLEKIIKIIPDKPKGSKSEKRIITKRFKNGHLRVILAAYDSEIKINPEIFNTADTGMVAIGCTQDQKEGFRSKYNDEFDYILCDDLKGSADLLLRAEGWMKDFNGYLIVQTGNIPKLTPGLIDEFYKSHKASDSECTILTTETNDKKIPYGKVIRNVANRITKVSEIEEVSEDLNNSEIYAGLLCFNTKILYKVLSKLNIPSSERITDLLKIVEAYNKNGSRVNTFMIKSAPVKHKAVAGESQDQLPQVKKLAGIIVSTAKFSPGTLKRLLEAMNSNNVESIAVIVKSENTSLLQELTGEQTVIVASDADMGDADDILKAAEKFRNFNGDILVLPDTDNIISEQDIRTVISKHNSNSNIITCIQEPSGRNLLYCVNSFQFFYSVKKVNKDEDTKKYYLSNIIEILKNDNKRIEIITPEELDR